ncbi:MAG: 4Fe-4S dicluster domain-containing protein [Omnitrophica bacterium]|nr:4Fe-4S dicluster domain-containing protein [Candidatus Omnitrophota bacterium]
MEKKEMVKIYIMGKEYKVPPSLTIMKALEYSGYKFIRGCGCRGGVCGACATVYRFPDSYKINVGLACQTLIEPDMYLTQIPFYPANRASYDIETIEPLVEEILKRYPEIARCLCCNTCKKACPQDLEVMEYIQAALRGDIERAAKLSFECILCGLCVSRCPSEIVHYNVGILCRRLFAKFMVPKAKDLKKRVEEIKAGKFDKEVEKYVKMSTKELKELYDKRDIEPV